MAFGQWQLLVAPPQPGTSNLPYPTTVPKGGLSGKFGGTTTYPPFVPVTVAVEDYYSWAIEAQTVRYQITIAAAVLTITGKGGSTMEGSLADIANKLAAINGNLSEMAANYKTMASTLSKIETNIAATAASKRKSNNTALTLTADKAKTNEFFKIYSGETPTLKSPVEFLKEKIKDASSFRSMMKVEGMVNDALQETTDELKSYFTEIAKEFGITKYIQDKIDTLKTVVPNPAALAKLAQSKAIVTDYGPYL
jgi:septal ring factor EnvC (AmiA/AmiB activator)